MDKSSDRVEVLPGPSGMDGYPEAENLSRRRLRVFLGTFLLCLLLGLLWDFQRPALYRASASVLTVAPPEVDQAGSEADLQHVAIQRQRMLGRPILEKVARELTRSNPEIQAVTPEQLRSSFQVVPVPETHLVELRAEGDDPLFLSLAVNTWIEAYLQARVEEVAALEGRTTESLRGQYEELGRKIEEKREALRDFRERNRILSTERDENQVLARLKGLNDSLNEANEEKIKARARLDAVKSAVARGEVVVPEQDKRAYAEMARRAQELREQVAEMNRRFTPQYIERNARLKVIPEQLARLEQKLDKSRREGRDFVLTQARQEYAAASQTVDELRKQLHALEQEASEFTARFSEYEAMQEDLAGLEALYRETEDRLVKVQTSNRRKYPQLQVVEWAYPPEKPIWPNYLRDAFLVAGASLLAALLMVWLIDFLRPMRKSTAPINMGIAVYPGNAALDQAATKTPALEEREPQQALSDESIDELKVEEVVKLLRHADPVARQLAALLLSGLTPEEILALEETDIDLEQGLARVDGRQMELAPRVVAWLEREGRSWLAWKTMPRFDASELDARLQMAAVDAGLNGVRVNAGVLRNTYLLYLIRQGVRLSDLESIAGPMPAWQLLELGKYSPEHAGKPLEEIETVYPLFV